jgi:hypothetical protein
MRLLSTGGWTLTTYYEYFSTNGFTYLSHVGPVGAIFGREYSEELGRLIGQEYIGVEGANFNANFWATDGVAAFGAIGVVGASILLALFLWGIRIAIAQKDQRASAVLMTGFWLAVLNGSLFTSLLSGGGLLIYFIVYLDRHRAQRAHLHVREGWTIPGPA